MDTKSLPLGSIPGISGYTEDHKDLSLTRANAKAIGAIEAHNSDLDGYIFNE